MAYVRKTDTLLSDIVATTYDMERKALALHDGGALAEIGSALHTNIRTCAETAAWKLAPELQYTMPEAWKVSRERIDVSLQDEDGSKLHSQVLNAPDHDLFSVPNINGGRYSYEVSVPFADMGEDVKAYALGAGDRKAKQTAIKESYTTTRQQLRLYLEQHASLNAALTSMPELELYVPEKYMAKFREKVAPRVKEKVSYAEDLGIDVDALAANAIAHRLTA